MASPVRSSASFRECRAPALSHHVGDVLEDPRGGGEEKRPRRAGGGGGYAAPPSSPPLAFTAHAGVNLERDDAVMGKRDATLWAARTSAGPGCKVQAPVRDEGAMSLDD